MYVIVKRWRDLNCRDIKFGMKNIVYNTLQYNFLTLSLLVLHLDLPVPIISI